MSTRRHAWIDASAGVAGDMLLGALVDAGADLGAVQQAVDAVIAQSVRIVARPVTRAGQRATKIDVEVLTTDLPHRPWSVIRDLLAAAALA
ncbi:MAG TPA: nickel insertion protein, partial [Propionibacteriaceae bacterium]|nr:nickel insertion protein [Propionibacteriaceae bacterium]